MTRDLIAGERLRIGEMLVESDGKAYRARTMTGTDAVIGQARDTVEPGTELVLDEATGHVTRRVRASEQ